MHKKNLNIVLECSEVLSQDLHWTSGQHSHLSTKRVGIYSVCPAYISIRDLPIHPLASDEQLLYGHKCFPKILQQLAGQPKTPALLFFPNCPTVSCLSNN